MRESLEEAGKLHARQVRDLWDTTSLSQGYDDLSVDEKNTVNALASDDEVMAYIEAYDAKKRGKGVTYVRTTKEPREERNLSEEELIKKRSADTDNHEPTTVDELFEEPFEVLPPGPRLDLYNHIISKSPDEVNELHDVLCLLTDAPTITNPDIIAAIAQVEA